MNMAKLHQLEYSTIIPATEFCSFRDDIKLNSGISVVCTGTIKTNQKVEEQKLGQSVFSPAYGVGSHGTNGNDNHDRYHRNQN